jgi:N-methylhydantoinase A
MPVSWDRFNAKRMTEMQSAFEKKYEELYGAGAGYTKAGIEISEIRVDAVGKVAKPRLSASRKRKSGIAAARKGKREIFFTRHQKSSTRRYDYEAGSARWKGPAVIGAYPTLVPPDHRIP